MVRAFVREDFEDRAVRCGQRDPDQHGPQRRPATKALIFPIVMIILNASTVAVLWFGGGPRVESGAMQVGDR